ncbi:hypothetical protein ABN099_09750, partial [Proteus hauseri]
QKQVQDAMVNYAMVQLSVDKPTAEAYIKTYDGMKIINASMTPLIGSVAARKIEALVSQQRLSSNSAVDSIVKGNTGNLISVLTKLVNIATDFAKTPQSIWGRSTEDIVKDFQTAPLTDNQKTGYLDLEKNGGIIVGEGKPSFEGGTKLPPTKVKIVRPEKEK